MRAPPQTAMQRAASLVPLRALLAEMGRDIGQALEGTGVTPDQVSPDAFIPYASFLAILDNARTVAGRDDIGLLLGQRQTLAGLGPLGEVMRHAATLGEAIADFAAFQVKNSTGGTVYLMRADRDVILGYGVYDATAPVSTQIYDLVIAVGCGLIAELTDGSVAPEEIHLSRPEPAIPSRYQRLARCPARFGQHQTGLLLRESTLDFPLPAANRHLHHQALARLLAAQNGAAQPLSTQVRHRLRPLLLMGRAGMDDVAARLGMHPRTMRRRLQDEQTTFETIKAEVRRAIARDLLGLGALDVADIAATLDYATPSSFVHAFQRWNGVAPGQWRKGEAGPRPGPRHSSGRC